MKVVSPPSARQLAEKCDAARVSTARFSATHKERYLHWDKLRHLKPPEGFSSEEWWFGLKRARRSQYREMPLRDIHGAPFVYTLPDCVLAALRVVDSEASGGVAFERPVATEENRDRFLFRSLTEEAIASSQLEGAATTRQAAADMIRARRKPRDHGERMIFNNYRAIRRVRDLAREPLTFARLMELHRTLTVETLEDADAAGRIQPPGSRRVMVVDNADGRVLHRPPAAEQLHGRMEALIAFANRDEAATPFIHPAIHAILLHFWLAYDHPFADGNGRTARALFYWQMLRRGYWLFEFISISRAIYAAPARYGRAFLYTESDDNDLTYFIVHQLQAIQQALEALKAHIARKTAQLRHVEGMLRRSALNHREMALISHAVRHPDFEYRIGPHQHSHRVSYATARADLLHLAELGLLRQRRIGAKTLAFTVTEGLEARIRAL